MEVGDTVLVHVTTFKGCHKIQDRWENREYVVEKWPYPNMPVYVVCLWDGEGCSQTLLRNYLLPINSYMEQGEMDKHMAGAENTTSPTPVPPVDSAPADAGLSGTITPSTTGSTPRVVQVNLPHLDMAPEPPGINSHGDTKILVYKSAPGHPMSGMPGLAFMPYPVCTMLSGVVQCKPHSTSTLYVCQMLLTSAFRGTSSM